MLKQEDKQQEKVSTYSIAINVERNITCEIYR